MNPSLENIAFLQQLPSVYWDYYDEIRFVEDEKGGISIWHVRAKATGEYFQIKRVPRGRAVNKHVERELLNRQTLLHPHIVSFSHVYMTDSTLDIFLESTLGQNMEFYLQHFGFVEEDHVRHFFQQLILAVDYCHKRKICVRNITLLNLVLERNLTVLKLNSFNLSKDLQNSVARSKVVSQCDYVAPEVLMSEDSMEYCGYTADMWSCGVCLYALIYGCPPFADPTDSEATRFDRTCHRILNWELTIPAFRKNKEGVIKLVSCELRSLLKGLLSRDPRRRLKVKDVLEHPWFLERLPSGALEMNAGVRPIDEKLLLAHCKSPDKKWMESILSIAAQPIEDEGFLDQTADYPSSSADSGQPAYSTFPTLCKEKGLRSPFYM